MSYNPISDKLFNSREYVGGIKGCLKRILQQVECISLLYDDGSCPEFKGISEIGQIALEHQYKLSSVNWFHNFGIDCIMYDELRYHEGDILFSDHQIYLMIYQTIRYWLTDVKKFWVIDSVNMESLMIKNLNHGKYLPATLKAIDEAYRLERGLLPWMGSRNLFYNDQQIPISFWVDPVLLTITFIH